MMTKPMFRGLSLAVAAVLLLVGYATLGALGDESAVVHFDVDANPRVVDEGELVEFEIPYSQYYDSVTGKLLEFTPVSADIKVWDFDDGSESTRVRGLHTSHRFADNRVGGYEVSVRILNSRNWVKVQVKNVPPEIYDILRTRPALQQEPVEFKALARDPGIDDKLTYSWEFGDGDTATGQHVEHTYVANGTYQVTVTVTDGDGGSDTKTFSIPIGDVGSFTVSGQVSLGEVEIENVILSATTANPFARKPTDPCLFKLDMFGASGTPMFTLSSTLVPGLGQRGYTIGKTAEWAGMHQDEAANMGVFFAELGLPDEIAVRTIGGKHIGGPFWGRGGRVSVDYFDGDYFEIRFRADLVENIPPSFGPRTAHVQGVVAQSIQSARGETTGAMLGSVFGGKFYFCGRDESSFDIAERNPAAEAINVDYLNPKIQITFTEEVDPRSIQGNLKFEFQGKSGFEAVPGSWRPMPGDPTSVEFIPQARLKQGTIHCLRVETEKEGVRGKEGETLEASTDPLFSDATRPACETQAMEFGQREWAFSTRPELRSAKVDVYQASVAGDGTPLVPGKPAVSRVYVDWTDPVDVHESAMVKTIPARVTVLAHNDSPIYAPKPRATIKRPSLFTPEDKKNARNSINFYNWKPVGSGSMSVKAKIEPLDENNQPVSEFEGAEIDLERSSRSEELSFDYWFVEIDIDFARACTTLHTPHCQKSCEGFEGEGGIEACVNVCLLQRVPGCVAKVEKSGIDPNWSDGIDPATRAKAVRLAVEGARFTTQNFPVIETMGWPQPDLEIGDLDLDQCKDSPGKLCFYGLIESGFSGRHAERYVAQALLEAGRESDADILVGFVPRAFGLGWAGLTKSLDAPGKRVVLAEVGQLNPVGLAHEFGHFFGQCHCPLDPSPAPGNSNCPPYSDDRTCSSSRVPPIQGMRVSSSGHSALNKHQTEGNQESNKLVPVMHYQQQKVPDAFITKEDYLDLFDAIANAPPRPEALLIPTPETQQQPSFLAALFQPRAAFAQSTGLLGSTVDVTGIVTDTSIRLERVRETHNSPSGSPPQPGPLMLELLDSSGGVLQAIPFASIPPDPWHGDPDEPSYFRISVPTVSGLQSVRVRGEGLTEAIRERSPSPPSVDAEVRTGSAGERIVNWSTRDTDGDEVVADVFLRADDDGPWRGAAIGIARTELTLEPRELPAGDHVTARIVVSDGFNTAISEVDLGPGAPLSVLTVTPTDGATDVSQRLDVVVWVSNPLTESKALVVPLPLGSFQLTDPEGEEVFADVGYQPGTRVLTLTPVEPLHPGTRYTATLEGLEDLWGNRLADPVSWSFQTGEAREDDSAD